MKLKELGEQLAKVSVLYKAVRVESRAAAGGMLAAGQAVAHGIYGRDAALAQQRFLEAAETRKKTLTQLYAERQNLENRLRRTEDRRTTLQARLATLNPRTQEAAQVAEQVGALGRAAQSLEGRLAKNRLTQEATLLARNAELFQSAGAYLKGALSIQVLGAAVSTTFKYNEALVGFNTDLATRNHLLRAGLEVQARTGASLEETAQALEMVRRRGLAYTTDVGDGFGNAASGARALAQELGMTGIAVGRLDRLSTGNLSRNLAATAATVYKLHVGLGLSYQAAEELFVAAQTARRPFSELADLTSAIADRTALTADEVAGLAAEYANLSRSYNLRTGDFAAALKTAAALEDSLRRQGARPDLAKRFLAQSADVETPAGRLSYALGAGPRILQDGKAAEEYLRKVAGTLAQFRQNPFALAAMARSFGLTRLEAQQLIDAQRELATSTANLGRQSKSLDQRFQEQSALSGQVYGQLFQNLKALDFYALTPVTMAVARLNKVLTSARNYVGQMTDSLSPENRSRLGTAAELAADAVMVTMATRLARGLLTRLGILRAAASPAVQAAAGAAAGGLLSRVVSAIRGVFGGPAAAGAATAVAGTARAWATRLLAAASSVLTTLATATFSTVRGLISGAGRLVEVPLLRLFPRLSGTLTGGLSRLSAGIVSVVAVVRGAETALAIFRSKMLQVKMAAESTSQTFARFDPRRREEFTTKATEGLKNTVLYDRGGYSRDFNLETFQKYLTLQRRVVLPKSQDEESGLTPADVRKMYEAQEDAMLFRMEQQRARVNRQGDAVPTAVRRENDAEYRRLAQALELLRATMKEDITTYTKQWRETMDSAARQHQELLKKQESVKYRASWGLTPIPQ